MKSKPRQMNTYSSLLSEYKTTQFKPKQIKIPTAKYHSYSSLNKSSNSQTKQKIPTNSPYNINSLTKKPKPSSTEDNKIDIKISVNYPKSNKPPLHKTKQQVSHQNCPHNSSHTRNISESNFYQNNLNISLTNFTQQSHPIDQHNLFASTNHPNALVYQMTEPNITIEEAEGGIHTPKATNIANNNIVFSAMNVNEFTLNNTNGRTAKFSTELNQASLDFIRNSLNEGLAVVYNETKEKYRDKELYDASNRKYELYKNALVQLGSIGGNEEEIELISMITGGISDLITFYHEKKEEMNKSYSDLFHKYIECQKDNQMKSTRLKMLKKKVDDIYNKREQYQLMTEGDLYVNKASSSIGYDEPVHIDSQPDLPNYNYNHRNRHERTNNNGKKGDEEEEHNETKKRTHTEENHLSYCNDNAINDLDSLYFSNKIPQTFSISYSHIPKLDLNFSTWKWKSTKHYPNQLHQGNAHISLNKNNIENGDIQKKKKTLINKIQNKAKTRNASGSAIGGIGVGIGIGGGGGSIPNQNQLHSFLKLSEICNGRNSKMKK